MPTSEICFLPGEIEKIVGHCKHPLKPEHFSTKLYSSAAPRQDLEGLHVYAIPIAYGVNQWCEVITVHLKTANPQLNKDLQKNPTGKYTILISHTQNYRPQYVSLMSYKPIDTEKTGILHGIYTVYG